MQTLFDWAETATPQPIPFGPERPTEIILAKANGLTLIDRKPGTGWTARLIVRHDATGATSGLSHVATWFDMRTDESALTHEQQTTAAAWWQETKA